MIVREQDGVKVILFDRLPPEVGAKVQALYARRNESMETHLQGVYAEQREALREILAREGFVRPALEVAVHGEETADRVLLDSIMALMDADGGSAAKFMDTWVVKFNHASIHDCAAGAVLGIEGISELVGKVIQHHALFSGTASSTRAIDMGGARLVDPIGSEASRAVHEAFMGFYRRNFSKVAEEVRRRYPRKDDESEKDYDNAVTYRVQDILGAFLPAGLRAHTSVTMNLRQWRDHLSWLLVHPLEEVRRVARFVQSVLRERYPSSGDFGGGVAAVSGVVGTDVEARAAWRAKVSKKFAYQPPHPRAHHNNVAHESYFTTTVQLRDLWAYVDDLADRPRGEILPRFLDDLGQCTASFLMSYRSWRDIERQRAGVCRMSVLTMEYGFAEWYLNQLPGAMGAYDDGDCGTVWDEAQRLLKEQAEAIAALTDDPLVRQYYIPMGYRVPTTLTYTLPVWVYVLELRTAPTVHPEVRQPMLEVVKQFRDAFGSCVRLHVDESPDPWSIRRGMQTIERKASASS